MLKKEWPKHTVLAIAHHRHLAKNIYRLQNEFFNYH